jgi:hypothetical protein
MEYSTTGVLWGWLWGMLPVLFLFGLAYSRAVKWLQAKGYDEGFVSLEVVVGVAATLLLLIPAIGPWAVLATILAFTASGLPMIAGSLWKYIQQREAAKRAVKGANHEQTQADAEVSRRRESQD